jgi:hypothetical protein
LILRLLISLRTAPYLLVLSPQFRAELRQRTETVAAETARISAIPGPVICSVSIVCRWAGKPYLYSAFTVHQQILSGSVSLQEVNQRLRAQHVHFELVDPRAIADWP